MEAIVPTKRQAFAELQNVESGEYLRSEVSEGKLKCGSHFCFEISRLVNTVPQYSIAPVSQVRYVGITEGII
jgi:hypothetical protein